MSSIKQTARLAGFLYLVYIMATVFASFVRGRLIVLGDAAATAENIATSEALFRLGFMSDVLAALLFVLSAWALYVLLKPVNNDLALLFVLLNLAGVAVQSLNMLNQFVIAYISYPLGFIAEVGLSLWLLIKGVQDQPATSLMTGRRPDTQMPPAC